MKKLLILLFSAFLLFSFASYVGADKEKATKEEKIKKQKKGPSERAYERANERAKFKRVEDFTPEEQEKLKKKKWSEMTDEEKAAVEDKYEGNKKKLEELKKNKKKLGEIESE